MSDNSENIQKIKTNIVEIGKNIKVLKKGIEINKLNKYYT